MNMRRTLAFTRRTLQQFRHDRRTLGFVIGMPLVMIVIFGYTFGGDVSNVSVAVCNFDNGSLSLGRQIEQNLSHDTLNIQKTSDVNGSKLKVDHGELWAVIVFPQNFTQNLIQYFLANGSGVPVSVVEVYIDGSNPNIAGAVLKTVNSAVIKTLEHLGSLVNKSDAKIPVNVTPTYAYGGADTKFIDYFAPGVLSFALMMVTTMITIILFVNERRNGTLQRLLASPARESEIVLGYALAFAIIGTLQAVVILTAAILLFGITIHGSILLAYLVLLLIGLGHQGLGILLSSGARNELQAIQFVPLIIFPSVLLSGLFWPVESIPEILRPLSYFLPLKYGIDAERSIMIRGWGAAEIWPQITVLVFFSVLMLGLAIVMLKRKKG
jgi:ABC-2 type transport system permease protein